MLLTFQRITRCKNYYKNTIDRMQEYLGKILFSQICSTNSPFSLLISYSKFSDAVPDLADLVLASPDRGIAGFLVTF